MELKTESEIEAAPERIWDILVAFDRYPEWNPFLFRIEGDLMLGARLKVSATSSEGRQWTFKPTIALIEPARELRWQDSLLLPGLFSGEQFFSLIELETGRTRLIHGGNFSGLIVKYMGRFLTEIARGFVGMNQALKRRAETFTPDPGRAKARVIR
jgi:hypothetical protein